MGKLTISMAMFNSYVKLPEGILSAYIHSKDPWPYSKGCCLALQGSEAAWLRTSNKMH